MATTPNGTVQDPMIVLKMMLVRQAHHPKSTGDGALAGAQNGTDQKNLGTTPDTQGKQRTKRKNDERQLRWQSGLATFYKLSVLHTQSVLRMHGCGGPNLPISRAVRTVSGVDPTASVANEYSRA
jgi:hypothetical protein